MNRIKILLTAAFAATAVTAVISCNNPSLEDRSANSADKQSPAGDERNASYHLQADGIEAQYFRGNYLYDDNGPYELIGDYGLYSIEPVEADKPSRARPVVAVISSRAEFEQNFGGYQRYGKIFADSTAKYTDDFFTNNFLVAFAFGEGSGSRRHRVEKIDANGDIIISRLIPEIGTCDMANWTVIIPMRNEYKLKEYKAVFVDKSI